MTDAELLLLIADGDRGAFERLHRRHYPWLALRLRSRCADPTLVEDVLQETFLAIWHGSARYRADPSAEVAGWLWQVAAHKLIDALRRTDRRQKWLSRLLLTRTDSVPSAEEQVLLGVEHGDLAGSLARLAPELRAVIQATVLDGLSTREAAVLLGIPEGTVKTRARRARAHLREDLA